MNTGVLQRRIGVIFQDFVRYQFKVGENIGVGDVKDFETLTAGRMPPLRAPLPSLLSRCPRATTLSWGDGSLGAKSSPVASGKKSPSPAPLCALMLTFWCSTNPPRRWMLRPRPGCLSNFAPLPKTRWQFSFPTGFSTVRRADNIMVLAGGKLIEQGTHEALLYRDGRYARLFTMQAAGYL
jgi:ATP-binding cassette subfamily B protein